MRVFRTFCVQFYVFSRGANVGDRYCWGYNGEGELGICSILPASYALPLPVIRFTAAQFHLYSSQQVSSGGERLPCVPSVSCHDSCRCSCRQMLWHSSRRRPRLSGPSLRSLLRCSFTLIHTVFITCGTLMQKRILCSCHVTPAASSVYFCGLVKGANIPRYERHYCDFVAILQHASSCTESGQGLWVIQRRGRCVSLYSPRGHPTKALIDSYTIALHQQAHRFQTAGVAHRRLGQQSRVTVDEATAANADAAQYQCVRVVSVGLQPRVPRYDAAAADTLQPRLAHVRLTDGYVFPHIRAEQLSKRKD